jgi:hypothetical protein
MRIQWKQNYFEKSFFYKGLGKICLIGYTFRCLANADFISIPPSFIADASVFSVPIVAQALSTASDPKTLFPYL